MDELLQSRVTQLKEIEDRLDQIQRMLRSGRECFRRATDRTATV